MSSAFDRCVARERARWRAWKRAWPGSCPSIAPPELVCRMRAESGELGLLGPKAQLTPALVGFSMGCVTFVVGTFLGAAVAPDKSLGWGAAYAVIPSIAAGIGTAKIYKESPARGAKILTTVTGAKFKVVQP